MQVKEHPVDQKKYLHLKLQIFDMVNDIIQHRCFTTLKHNNPQIIFNSDDLLNFIRLFIMTNFDKIGWHETRTMYFVVHCLCQLAEPVNIQSSDISVVNFV